MQMYDNDYYSYEDCKSLIKPRQKDTNKSSYGRVGIVAGSKGMTGAVCMSSVSALRSGSGLVYTIIPDCICDIVSIKLTECVIRAIAQGDKQNMFFTKNDATEAMKCIADCDCIVLGPGIGTNQTTKDFVRYIMMNYNKTIVLDADGLNCVCENVGIFKLRKATTIITPHPKEFERLLEHSKLNYIDRITTAKEFSAKYNVVTLLKGYNTVIANGENNYRINPTGNPGMATAGSGDVLAGVIASLVGQGLSEFDAACCGAFIHGLAGDKAAANKGEYGIIASDIIENIPYAINDILKF